MVEDIDLEINPKIRNRKVLSPYGIVVTITSISFIILFFTIFFAVVQYIITVKRRRARRNSGDVPLLPARTNDFSD